MGGYRNKEGYPDPTAGEALGAVAKEEREQNKAVTTLITMLKQMYYTEITIFGLSLNMELPHLKQKHLLYNLIMP